MDRRRNLKAISMQRRWFTVAAGVMMVIAVTTLSINGCSTFNAKPDVEARAREQESAQWSNGRFSNQQPMWSDMRGTLAGLFTDTEDVSPHAPVPVVSDRGAVLHTVPPSGLRVTWFGHSSTLLEIDGIKVLIDPLWSDRASPVSWAGPKRWYPPPIALTNLPPIDAVVISHDHYDHFDRVTLVTLAKETHARFIVPLGVGAFLRAWGIAQDRIDELDWWQSTQLGAVTIIATPSRHHSGRISPQSDLRLWAGYAFVGGAHRVWYSGDTGFHAALAQIGKRLGPFDVTLIEAGQYDATWPDWHLGPEQAVQANRLVGGKKMIPVHWGLIQLAHHAWTEPAERVLVAAACWNVEVIVPRPGQSVEPTDPVPLDRWWPRTAWHSAAEKPIIATRDGVGAHRYPVEPCVPRP
jgi:L-ascorbate metabolism protein UlaG (beta-lactamase superfamily)